MSFQPYPTHPALKYLPAMLFMAISARSGGQTPYSFGNPTGDEQMYIELINRARANPTAEGQRLAGLTDPAVLAMYQHYGVDLEMMKREFAATDASAPLAPNASLTTAARSHTLWMFNNATQSHDETGPANDPEERITDAGYDFWSYGENVYAYAKGNEFGHAGFEVDWGSGGPGGMQDGRGHRYSIHYADFREIGVGVLNGTNGGVGPQLVTQDFGEPFSGQSFGTGVAYYDLNTNGAYDSGEGIGGLTVNVSGATKYCTTATGGGWVVPIPAAAATRTTTFSGLGINQTRSLVVPNSTNAKVDLKLAYTPPTITSAASAEAGGVHAMAFSTVAGATGYKWTRWNSAAATTENCDSAARITASTSPNYVVLNTAVKQEGTAALHLANPGIIGKQIVELNALFHGLASPSLTFQSRLRTSTGSERHLMEVKEEGSTVWQGVYNQAGGTPESGFSPKSVLLPGMAGKEFRVRFVLHFPGGSTYSNTGDTYGWFIDAISFDGISELTNSVSQVLAGSGGSFTPAAGTYLMAVAPVISGIEFPKARQMFTATAPAASGFATWAASVETANSLAAGMISNNPQGDPDGDGRSNLVEYAFNTAPMIGGEASPRLPVIQGGTEDFLVRYVRDTSLADIELVPVACADLATWKSPGQSGAPAGFSDSLLSTAGPLQTREARIPFAAGSRWFLKMKVTRP